jgi:hypothetical protein
LLSRALTFSTPLPTLLLTRVPTLDCTQENRKKSAIVQKISNPKKLQALSKKKRAKLVAIPDAK